MQSRLKLIPRVVEGNWLVKKSVGTQPAILGKQLVQTYHYDEKLNYFEVDHLRVECCFHYNLMSNVVG